MSKINAARGGSDMVEGTFGPGGNPRNLDDYCAYVNREFGHMCLASIIQPAVPPGVPPPPRQLHIDFSKTARKE